MLYFDHSCYSAQGIGKTAIVRHTVKTLRNGFVQTFEQVGNELTENGEALMPWRRIFAEMCKVKEKDTPKAKAASFLAHVKEIKREWIAEWGKHMIRYIYPEIPSELLQLDGNANLDHWKSFASETISRMAEKFFTMVMFAASSKGSWFVLRTVQACDGSPMCN